MPRLYFRIGSDWEIVQKTREEISKLESQIRSMDANKSPGAVAVLNNQLQQSQSQLRSMTSEAAKAAMEMDGDFKSKIYQGSQAVNDFTQKIIAQKTVVQDVQADVRRLTDAYRAVRTNPLQANNALSELNAAKRALNDEKAALNGLQTEQAKARLSVKQLRDEYALYDTQVKDTTGSTFSLGKAFGVIGGVAVLKQLGSEIINVRGQFRSMEISLQTMVGESKAKELQAQIKQYAAISPLELKDVQSATEMMVGFNIEADKVPRYVQAIGDISRGESGKFQSLSLAFSQMSAAGKLMGQDLNQMINAGFNPLQQISSKTGKSIAELKKEMEKGAISAEMVQQAFIDATSAGGKFYGMSQKQSQEVAGQMSILSDTINNKLNDIGASNEGLIKSGISGITSLVNNYETVGRVITGLVATYGTYRAALILNAVLEEGFSKSIWSKIAATKAAAVAQAAYNKILAMNPYVAVGAAVIALGIAMWTLSDHTTAAEKAQKDYNDAINSFNEAENKRKSILEGLVNELNNELTADTRKVEILRKIKQEYPIFFKFMLDEKGHVKDLTDAWKAYNEEVSKNKVNFTKNQVDSIKGRIDEEKKVIDLRVKNNTKGITGFTPSSSDKLLLDKYSAKSDNEIKKDIEKNEKELWKFEKDARDDGFNQWVVDLKQKTDSQISAIRAALVRRAKAADGDKNLLSALGRRITAIDEEKKSRGTNTNYQQDLSDAKKEWDDAKKTLSEIEKDKDKFTSKQYDDAKKKVDSAESKYKALGGVTGNALTKQEKEADRIAKQKATQENSISSQNDKILEMDKKQFIERERQNEDLENQLSQSKIDAMSDGFEKEQSQRELNNKKEIQAIKRQKEDYIQTVIQAEKEKFDAQEELKSKQNPKYKKKTFDSSSLSVDTSSYDAIENNITTKQQNDQIKNQEKAWNEYLIKFGNYQQKRQAIIEKYNKQINEAKYAGDAASLEKDKQNELDSLDNSVKNSTTLMGELFADASRKSVNEIQTIIDKAELLMEYLEATKDSQGNANIGGKTVSKRDILNLGISDNTLQNLKMSTEELEALRSAISKLKGELATKSPFVAFKDQIKEAIKDINKGGKKNVSQGISEIGSAVSAFAPAMEQFGQDLGNIFGSDDLGNKISGIAGAIGGLGQTAVGVGQIMSGDIVGGAMSAVSGISKVVTSLDGLFGANYDKYNKAKEEYKAYIDILDDVIERQKEMVASLDNENATKSYEYAKSLLDKSAEAARSLGVERLNSGSSAGSHSIGVRQRKDMSTQAWNEAKSALGSAFNQYGIGDGRMTGLFSLSVDQLKKLQDEAPTFWAKLDDDVRGYLEDIIKANKSAEELKDTLYENLTGISFDSLFDNFLDSLYDMKATSKATSKDISNDMADDMRKSLIKAFAVENYKDKMKEWYTKWAEALKDGVISSDEQKSLDDLKNSIITGATESAKLINDQFGYLNDATSQEASSKGFQTMDQDTGNELNGRFTALQIAGEEIKQQNIKQTGLLSSINEKMTLLDYADKTSQDTSISTSSYKGTDEPLSTPNVPDIATKTKEAISNIYQPQINVSFPDAKIDALTNEVINLKYIVDDMRTIQAEDSLNSQEIAEYTKVLSKNTPKIINHLEDVNNNTKRL